MKVGFIGVGNMGNNMAANLLKAGHEVQVNDIRKESADNLLDEGAIWTESPKAAASGTEICFMSLPKPADVQDVMRGDSGVLAGMAAGTTIIDLSTNSPLVVKELAAEAAAKGVQFIDGPVSGGVVGARKGTLAVMCGGDQAVFDAAKPVLDAIGANVFRVGDVGAGNVAKLVNNMLAFINMMGITEALVLGAKAGVEPHQLWEIVKASSGNSMVWQGGGRAILRDRLAPSFTVDLACKDIGLATDLGDEVGSPLPMGKAAEALLQKYRETGYADQDVLATVKAIEEEAGFTVRNTWPEDA